MATTMQVLASARINTGYRRTNKTLYFIAKRTDFTKSQHNTAQITNHNIMRRNSNLNRGYNATHFCEIKAGSGL